MRYFLPGLAILAATSATAYAGEKPVIGPPPAWVKPVSLPAAPLAADAGPVSVLLLDQQLNFQAGRQTVYSDTAVKIQTPQGLAIGNLSFPWRPDTDELTVHKLLIRRGDQII